MTHRLVCCGQKRLYTREGFFFIQTFTTMNSVTEGNFLQAFYVNATAIEIKKIVMKAGGNQNI